MTKITTTTLADVVRAAADPVPIEADTGRVPVPRKYSPRPRREELLGRFLGGFSALTRQAYEADLVDFAKWLDLDGPGQATAWFLSLDSAEVNQTYLDYVGDLKRRHKSAATINRRRATLRSLLAMGRMLGVTQAHLEVRRERNESYRDTLGPTVDKVRAMLTDLQTKAQCGNVRATRDFAIVCLLFHRGLRKAEAIGLDVDHYDRERERISIKGKGRAGREWVTLSPAAIAALDNWLAVRGDSPGPIFNPVRGGIPSPKRLVPEQVNRFCRHYGIRPHGLRHAAITLALEKTNGDVTKVQQFSRHRDVRAVMIYDDRRQDFGGEVSKMLDETVKRIKTDVPEPLTDADYERLTPMQARHVRAVLSGRSVRRVAEDLRISRRVLVDTLTRSVHRIPRLRRLLELIGARREA